jgi:hypothetical protein
LAFKPSHAAAQRHITWAAKLQRAIVLPIAIAATVALTSCAPMPVADDEGHATFAREAIKQLLGRPARNTNEVESIADIAKLLGRNVAAKMLMKETEFVDTWAAVLIDLLQVQREDASQLAGQDKTCWGAPTRVNPDPAIALWVRNHGPTDPNAPAGWNMTDLLRSAIALDDLSPVVRAYLFPLSMRRAIVVPGSWEEDARRGELAQRFLRTYLNRDLVCLGCHNPTFSASNKTDPTTGNIVWQRLFAIPGHAEKALFGDYFDAGTAIESLVAIMRGDVRKPTDTQFGTQPWGMAQSCGLETSDDTPANDPLSWRNNYTGIYKYNGFQTIPTPNTSEDAQHPYASFGSLKKDAVNNINNQLSLWELEGALRSGIAGLRNGYTRTSPSSSTLPATLQKYCDFNLVLNNKCKSCHNGSAWVGYLNLKTPDPAAQLVNVSVKSPSSVAANKRVVPSNLTTSELWRRVNNAGPLMPYGGPALLPGDLLTINDWIMAGAPHTSTNVCNNSHLPDVDPDEAFAYLTATNLVDGIWMAAMGSRLTIGHGYSRNSQQMNMLWNLTEFEFLPNNWSLKTVLTKTLASDWYARRAPAISQSNTAYKLPPILDPWVVADPTQVSNPAPHQQFDGQGEEANRFRVSTLLRLVAGSLGWKQPTLIPDNNYPSALALNLGQYVSPQNQGVTGVNFQSLLALESETGACDKTNRAGRSSGLDWIDAVVAGISAFNSDPAHAGAPITLGEAWMMLKDRLIQDPSINNVLPSGLSNVTGAKTEEQALVAFLRKVFNDNTLTLNTSTGAASVASALGPALRNGCGILVKSPQFILANITPKTYSDNNMPGPLRLNICLPAAPGEPAEPCSYAQVCEHWRQTLYGMGYNIACLDRSVVRLPWVYFPDYATERLVSSGPPSGHDWSVLTRHSTEAQAQLRLSGPAQPIKSAQPPQRRKDAATASPPVPASGPQFDLMQSVRVSSREPLRGLGRLHQRLATLCPGGVCGFVQRPASSIARCVENPQNNSCLALFPPCDPRSQHGSNSCGALPADFADSGVLAIWAEGAEVKETANARLLRAGDARWQPLRAGVKLAAGDMIDLSLASSLRLQIDDVAFGDTSINEAQVSGLAGHLLAITGPSAEKLLERAPARGDLSPAAMIRGVQSGAFEPRAMTAKDWKRAVASIASSRSGPPLTPVQIREMNSNHNALHRGIPKEMPK